MRINLSPAATQALEILILQLKAINSSIDKTRSEMTSEIIVSVSQMLDHSQQNTLADRLVSTEGKRRALLKRLDEVSLKTGTDGFASIETAIKKFDHLLEKTIAKSEGGSN